jgi:TRAP-type C4-dicarboxylate transport system permease small subunit
MIQRLAYFYGRLLEIILILLMVGLTVIVAMAVIYRKVLEDSLSWYDEVASIMLIWITYYGAALAALRRKHIGFDGFLLSLPERPRLVAFIISEALIIGFFALFAYGGWLVFQVVAGDNLISLTWVPQQLPHSVIPIGGMLFIAAEILSIPEAWRAISAGKSLEHEEIEEEIRHAQEEARKVKLPGDLQR